MTSDETLSAIASSLALVNTLGFNNSSLSSSNTTDDNDTSENKSKDTPLKSSIWTRNFSNIAL